MVDPRGLLTVDAFVVELGAFLSLSGVVESPVSGDEFRILLDPEQEVASDDSVPVVLQAAPAGGNDTQFLTTTGAELEPEDIFEDAAVVVEGVLVAGASDFLKAALVVVDLERLGEVLVGGTVVDVFENGFSVSTESNLCNRMSELEVLLDDETTLLRIIITEDDSTVETEDEVSLDDVVSVTGMCDVESLLADAVLVIEDQRIED